MVLSLSYYNVIQYLQDAGIINSEDNASYDLEVGRGNQNNFNFLITLAENRQLLVKQEHGTENDGIPHELFKEWLFHQLLERFPVLGNNSAIAPLVVHFDEENSIIVRNYLTEYIELLSFYQNNQYFPEAITIAIGTTLGVLHRATFNRQEYRNFMATAPLGQFRYHYYNPAQGIELIKPEIFGQVPVEALKFYALYQRSESLEAAIAELAGEWNPCCLTHNHLNLDNILVHSKWEQLDDCLVRLIDWKTCGWGDPTFDLGTLIANYLEIWLCSLVVDPTIKLEETLELAVTPLEVLQPSILSLIRAYLNAFPKILEYRSDFLLRVVQFAGLVLIHKAQEMIQERKHFNRINIYTLQVAKSLLTLPQESVLTVFGITESEIIKPFVMISQPQTEKKQNLHRLYYEKTRLRGC